MKFLWGLFPKQALIFFIIFSMFHFFFFFWSAVHWGRGVFLVFTEHQSTRSNYWILTAPLWGVDMIDTESWRGAVASESTQAVRADSKSQPCGDWLQSPSFQWQTWKPYMDISWWLPGSERSSSLFSQNQDQQNKDWIRYREPWVLFHPLPAGGSGHNFEDLCTSTLGIPV